MSDKVQMQKNKRGQATVSFFLSLFSILLLLIDSAVITFYSKGELREALVSLPWLYEFLIAIYEWNVLILVAVIFHLLSIILGLSAWHSSSGRVLAIIGSISSIIMISLFLIVIVWNIYEAHNQREQFREFQKELTILCEKGIDVEQSCRHLTGY